MENTIMDHRNFDSKINIHALGVHYICYFFRLCWLYDS